MTFSIECKSASGKIVCRYDGLYSTHPIEKGQSYIEINGSAANGGVKMGLCKEHAPLVFEQFQEAMKTILIRKMALGE